MNESRPSTELIRAGRLPPCRIVEGNGAAVFGSGCEGSLGLDTTQRVFDHRACPGWWPESTPTPNGAGFRCSCDCHATEHGWPGWDLHVGG